MTLPQPYISIVIASRNDNHQGNMLERIRATFGGLFEQLDKHEIESELILIEWNPPIDAVLLKDAISWPKRSKYCTIRNIIVPASVHRGYNLSDKMPMIREIAINYGIRRARGQFILPGTTDHFYSEELMALIGSRQLETDVQYRTDRCDVDSSVLERETLNEQLEFCRNNITYIKSHNPRIRRWREPRNRLPDLHTSAAGDFQLLSRDYWHKIRGYSEEYIFAYGDGLLSYMAFAAGAREVILTPPLTLYHIDHDNKFLDQIKTDKLPLEQFVSLFPDWLGGKFLSLYRILLIRIGYRTKSTVLDKPVLDYNEYQKIARDMVDGKRPCYLNSENWGLAQETQEEHIINVAEWDDEYRKN